MLTFALGGLGLAVVACGLWLLRIDRACRRRKAADQEEDRRRRKSKTGDDDDDGIPWL